MSVISITDLNSLINPTWLTVPIDAEQKQFQLVMKQTCMKLPTEPLLVAYPQIDRWIMEVGLLFPEIFEWEPPKLLVDTHCIAKICIGEKDVYMQIATNLVFLENGCVTLIEWAIRHPSLNWSDKVKLWVTTEYLSLLPEKLKLTILALHPTYPTKKHEISWDTQQHEKTRDWLVSVLKGQTAPIKKPIARQVISPLQFATLPDFNIEEIPEIEI